MRADLLQHLDIAQFAEPVLIIDHDRIGRSVAERQQAFEDGANPSDIVRDGLVGQHLAALVAPRGIADPRGPAAHQHNRLVARLLQPPEHHDLDQAADMQRGRGCVEADIARDDLRRGELVEAFGVGKLVDVAALIENAQEIGIVVGHDAAPASS